MFDPSPRAFLAVLGLSPDTNIGQIISISERRRLEAIQRAVLAGEMSVNAARLQLGLPAIGEST
jgi:hypothetical protein